MKSLFCALLLLGAQTCLAQTHSPWVYQYVTAPNQGLYRQLEDTLSKPKLRLHQGERVLVVGQQGQWVEIRLGTYSFFMRRATLSTVAPGVPAALDASGPGKPRTLEELLKLRRQ